MPGRPAEDDGATGGRRPTMADVAVAAGVSRPLVSIVMRGVEGASRETRERVLRVADEIGYRPHAGAQMLRRARSRNLGVLFTPRFPFEVEIVEAIYPAAQAKGYHIVLGAQTPGRSLDDAVAELLGYQCEALLVVGSDMPDEWFADLARRVPVVRLSRHLSAPGVDVVRSDDHSGVREAVEHLAGLGHRRIVHVDGGDMPGAADRRHGYLDTMRELGLEQDARILTGDYSDESGAQAALTLLAEPALPTAIVMGNDWSAFGLLTAFWRHGVRVPEDVSVVGYDDSRLAALSVVQLTTVRQDARLMGRLAAEAAADLSSGVRSTAREHLLQPRLVVRGTTTVPRSS